MPWFYFDLVVGDQPHAQGGMILENVEGAQDRADALAEELRVAKPKLDRKHCFVRVINEADTEIYRTPLEPISKSSVQTHY
jgi:uncharacterized protein DUF6894